MSFVIGDLLSNSPDYASLAQQSEAQRRALINLGQKEISAVFGGGTAPFYNQATGAFDPTKSYYRFGGAKGFTPYYTPQSGGGGFGKYGGPGSQGGGGVGFNTTGATLGAVSTPFDPGGGAILGGLLGGLFGGDSPATPQQQFATAERNKNLYTQQNPTFQGFTPDFYNQRAQAYVDYAMPQLAQQYRNTRNQIGFGLANRGSLGSGTARQQFSDLARTNQAAVQGIADTGRSQAQSLQQQVENTKNTLINQLYQSADPSQGVSQAISQAAGFAQPSTFAPLANTFSNLINQYYANQILNPRQGSTLPAPSYGSGLNLGALPGNYSVGS